jgi:hypothetical protein
LNRNRLSETPKFAADRRNQGAAKDRVVTADEVIAGEPDLIIGSWSKEVPTRASCGAAWLRPHSRGAASTSLRNQIVLDLAARARRVD